MPQAMKSHGARVMCAGCGRELILDAERLLEMDGRYYCRQSCAEKHY